MGELDIGTPKTDSVFRQENNFLFLDPTGALGEQIFFFSDIMLKRGLKVVQELKN